MSKLFGKDLNTIFKLGEDGTIPDMTQEDWTVLQYLVNKSCKTNYEQGMREGVKKGYRLYSESVNNG